MKTTPESSCLEKAFSLHVLVVPRCSSYFGADFRRISEALKYQREKGCYGLCIFKKGHSSPLVTTATVPEVAFVSIGLPKGDARARSRLWATAQGTRVRATPFPSCCLASWKVRTEKFAE